MMSTGVDGLAVALLRASLRPESSIGGLVTKVSGHIASVCLWNHTLRGKICTNNLAAASMSGLKGLSEFQLVMMCRELSKCGIAWVNPGGSETQNLDRLKRKMGPSASTAVYSLGLASVDRRQ